MFHCYLLPGQGLFAGGYQACIAFTANDVQVTLGIYSSMIHFRAEVDLGTSTHYNFDHMTPLIVVSPVAIPESTAPDWAVWMNEGRLMIRSEVSVLNFRVTDLSGRELMFSS